MVNAIKGKRGVKKVTLIGWSWGAMMAGYYASLCVTSFATRITTLKEITC
jgi:dienelactone hydrolase